MLPHFVNPAPDYYICKPIAGLSVTSVNFFQDGSVFYFIIHRWFKDFAPGFVPTLLWGIAVQAAQVVCVYLIMAAVGIPAHSTEYVFLFLLSSVVAVLPLTIGGLGAREIVFLEGAKYFGLQQETSVVISLLFYLITLVTSAAGLLYVFKDPLKEKDPLLSP